MNVETKGEFMDFWEMIIILYNIFCISTWFFNLKFYSAPPPPKLGNGFLISSTGNFLSMVAFCMCPFNQNKKCN